jgi:hypothetical protein
VVVPSRMTQRVELPLVQWTTKVAAPFFAAETRPVEVTSAAEDEPVQPKIVDTGFVEIEVPPLHVTVTGGLLAVVGGTFRSRIAIGAIETKMAVIATNENLRTMVSGPPSISIRPPDCTLRIPFFPEPNVPLVTRKSGVLLPVVTFVSLSS